MNAREWLAVFALPGLGPQRLARIVAQAPEWPEGWLALLPRPAAAALRLWLEHPARSPLTPAIEASLAWEQAAPEHTLLHRDHPDFPALLSEIPDPPAVLWAQGDLHALGQPGLAVVGSRRPTAEGAANARTFAHDLARRGFCVTSGMALGIDAEAQRAALDIGGASIAVLATGIDVIYPARHRELYQRLGSTPGGLLLAEHPLGTRAHPAFFPRRNRIVTGLSLGTLVVEAAEKSGSLVSARLALEQGRELFALPTSLHNVQARGSLQLLRTGATLVCESDDIVAELTQWAGHYPSCQPPLQRDEAPPHASAEPLDAQADAPPDELLAALGATPTPIDALVQQAGLSVGECQQRLLMLELDGRVAQQPGGWIRRMGL
ncbi:MAG: DNA-processing protein DprA [Halomonas sp.]|nr:DNA-processing protein DprA [Halomonas sp.]MDN6296634.1 DNA-processing protein DprA [Halomonas sp.]MDN6314177.1 DNA-processing protein DprA [Halomonas sp.]MDN6335140.1 DNA-processing protein DprA [Halomonas sp.]